MAVKFRNYSAAIARVISQGAAAGLTPHEVLIGNAAGGIGQVSSLGSAGQVLSSQGPGADPAWQAVAAGNVTPTNQWLMTGAIGDSYYRWAANGAVTITSTNAICAGLPLTAGQTVTKLGAITWSAFEVGGSHGWYALLDPTGKVVAVTADQTGNTWGTPDHATELFVTAAYNVPSSGLYYAALSVTATTVPNFAGRTMNRASAIQQAPILCGTLGVISAPPAVGTTLTITPSTLYHYAYFK